MPRLQRASRALLPFALSCAACASAPPPPAAPPAWTEARREEAAILAGHLRDAGVAPPRQVVVRLAFAPGADLDLYVTDPLLETVYYANTPVRSGGTLERDERCDGPGRLRGAGGADEPEEDVHVETVRFEAPPPGRYRVGVDYPHRCEGGDAVTPYVVSIEAKGAREEIQGLARQLEFTTIAAEFEVE